MSPERILRHRTAISRAEVSRPVRIAMGDGILTPEATFFDYGCGKGDDIKLLEGFGIKARGWDPAHRPDGERTTADVVNIGYVVNVIEDHAERAQALLGAWALAGRVLVVAARLDSDKKDSRNEEACADGVVTRLRTFQKYFQQSELRAWIDGVLEAPSLAAAPGVFYVFRDEELRETFLASRYRRRAAAPRRRLSDVLFEEHQNILQRLMDFFAERGRLPVEGELAELPQLEEVFGSVRKAFALIKRVTDSAQWTAIVDARREDLLVYTALGRLGGRPRFGALPERTRRDIRALFGAYTKACKEGDDLLFSAGNKELVDAACRSAPVGKETPSALYVHMDALSELPPILRVYEACARSFLGLVEGANVVKLHRVKSQVSYLSYPDFRSDPHPALKETVVANLEEFRIFYRDYSDSENPPVLHRKEQFVSAEDSDREKFSRLTAQEERKGLYSAPEAIGFRRAWEELLVERGLQLRGHRLCKAKQ